jgi:hypothetical protein
MSTLASRQGAIAERSAPGPDGMAGSDRLSVIVAVLRDQPAIEDLHRSYREVLQATGRPVEFVYVLAHEAERAGAALRMLKAAGEPLVVVVLSRFDGEAAALRSGLRHTGGETVLILPPTPQVEPTDLPELLQALETCDVAVATRSWPGGGSTGLGSSLFHGLIRRLFGRSFSDLPCRVRACRRGVLEEVGSHSPQQHFLPLFAAARGFRIREVEVRGVTGSAVRSGLGARLRLALDVLALFMVLRFVRRPLRFFGALGVPILATGLLFTSWLAFARLVFGMPLADRPALVLGVLLIVLGIQVIALGLMGEIIIFASGRRIRDYDVERVA